MCVGAFVAFGEGGVFQGDVTLLFGGEILGC